MAIKTFDSNKWLAEHGYESSYSGGGSSKTTSTSFTTPTGIEVFDANKWMRDRGYEMPVFRDYVKDPLQFEEVSYKPTEFVGTTDEVDGGTIQAGVGSFGAGVINLLRNTVSGIYEKPLKLSLEGLKLTKELVTGEKTFEQAKERVKEVEYEKLQPEYTKSNQVLKPVEDAVRKWADVQDEGWFVQSVAGAVESTPAMLASAFIPVVGSMLMFNQSFSNQLEQDVIIANAKAQSTGMKPDYDSLITKAVASGAIEVATEKLFNLFGGVKGAAKGLLETTEKGLVSNAVTVLKGFANAFVKEEGKLVVPTIGKLALYIARKSAEEGIEEIASTFLNGIVARATTDKGKSLFATKENPDGIITWEEMRNSFVGGAVMGGVFSATNGISSMVNTKRELKAIQDKRIDEITNEDKNNVNIAMKIDANNPEVQSEIKGKVLTSIYETQVNTQNGTLRSAPIDFGDATFDAFAPTPLEQDGAQVEVKPQRTMKQIIESNPQSIEDAQVSVKEWVDSDEGKKFTNKYKSSEDVAVGLSNIKQELLKITESDLSDDAKALKLKEGWLQTLALKEWADRIADTPEGKRLRSFIGNIIPRLTFNKSQADKTYIEALFNDNELFYEVMPEEKTKAKAEELSKKTPAEKDMYIQSRLSTDANARTMKPEDVVFIGKYVQELLSNTDNEQSVELAHSYMDMLASKATLLGQTIESFKILYSLFPEYKAKSFKNKLENTVTDKEEQHRIDIQTKDTEKVVNEYKKRVLAKVGATLDNDFENAELEATEDYDDILPEPESDEEFEEKVKVEKEKDGKLSAKTLERIKQREAKKAQREFARKADRLIKEQIRQKRALEKAIDNAKTKAERERLELELKQYKQKMAESAKAQRDASAKADKQFKSQPFMKLANKIKQDLVQTAPETQTEVTRMLNELLAKYKQTVPESSRVAKMDVFEFLTEIALNRSKYAQVYEQAKQYLATKYADRIELKGWFEQATDPVIAERTMQSAISKMMKEHEVSASLMAREYVLLDYDLTRFDVWFNEKFGFMDENSRQYLYDSMARQFQDMMESKAIDMTDVYEKALGRQKVSKDMQTVTIDALQTVTFYNAFQYDAVKRLWADRMGIAYIDDAMTNKIYQAMKDIAKIEATTNDQLAIEQRYESMIHEVFKDIPSTLQDKINAIRRFGMLGNLRTPIKNGINNMVAGQVYKMADKVQKFISEKVKWAYVSPDARDFGDKIIKKGDNKDIDNVVTSRSANTHLRKLLEESSNYSISSLRGVAQKIFPNERLDKIMKLPYEIQQTGLKIGKKNIEFVSDIYMFRDHFQSSMRNKLNQLGYNESLSAETKELMIKEAEKFAQERAIVRTFRQLNMISNAIKHLRSGKPFQRAIKDLYDKAEQAKNPQDKEALYIKARELKKASKAVGLAVDFVTPFVVTPAALAKEGYKFSPVALAITTAQIAIANKQGIRQGEYAERLNRNFAQAFTGTMSFAVLGIVLSGLGLLNLEPPEDKKEKEQWLADGRSAYSLYIPGYGSLSLDWLQPIITPLIMGGSLAEVFNKNEQFTEELLDAFVATGDSLINKTIIDNIFRNFGGYGNKSVSEKIADIGINGIAQSFPSIIQQMNKVIDPQVRDIYAGNSFEILKNRFLASIPGGSFAIEAKYDVWGNPITQTKAQGVMGFGNRFIMNFLSPFTVSESRMDSVTKEVNRLYEATKTDKTLGSYVLPSGVENGFTVTNNNIKKVYEFNDEQYLEYQQIAGQYQKQAVEKLLAKDTYKKMTDIQKAKTIKIALADAKDNAKKAMVKKYPTSSAVIK